MTAPFYQTGRLQPGTVPSRTVTRLAQDAFGCSAPLRFWGGVMPSRRQKARSGSALPRGPLLQPRPQGVPLDDTGFEGDQGQFLLWCKGLEGSRLI